MQRERSIDRKKTKERMLYFIPAWYEKGSYDERLQPWYSRRMYSEIDETVNQMRLFYKNHREDSSMILLSYSPTLRYFLHRQGIYHFPYWSCFDAMLGYKGVNVRPFSYKQLSWPKNVEFVYTNFKAIVLSEGEPIAQVEFGEDGNLICVDLLEDGAVERTNYYDDRGFLSSSRIYDQGEILYREYYDFDGDWKMRHFEKDDVVMMNPEKPFYSIEVNGRKDFYSFREKVYKGLNTLILEVTGKYLELTAQEDVFFVAADQRHIEVMETLLLGRKTIVTFFENRFETRNRENLEKITKNAIVCITDTEEQKEILYKALGTNTEIKRISPYHTGEQAVFSATIPEENILVLADDVKDDRLQNLIRYFDNYIGESSSAKMTFITRRRDTGIRGKLNSFIRKAMLENARPEFEDRMKEHYAVEECIDEAECVQCVRKQRILLDLREEKDLYIQMLAITYGVPQIAQRESELLIKDKNGMIVPDEQIALKAVQWYLDRFANWNKSRIYAVELAKKYSAAVIYEQWREVLKSIG